MKLAIYECDRCREKFEIEESKKPITVEHLDARFSNAEKETLHLCDDCYMTFLYAMQDTDDRRKAFDKLAEKFSDEDEREGKNL